VRIACIDHSYHAQTGSTIFFLDLLREVAAVDMHWDDGWLGRENVDLKAVSQHPRGGRATRPASA